MGLLVLLVFNYNGKIVGVSGLEDALSLACFQLILYAAPPKYDDPLSLACFQLKITGAWGSSLSSLSLACFEHFIYRSHSDSENI